MEQSEFLYQTTILESALFSLAPSFDRHKGIAALLQSLTADGKVSRQTAAKLHTLWQKRNAIMNAKNANVDPDAEILLKEISTELKLQ